jgi:dephospho-CoA kinase
MTALVIGLTGGIGTGKSHVRHVLVSLGAEGIDADRVAHEVMLPDGPAYAEVVAAFGPEVVAADGRLDRAALGRRVFADAAALARLEAFVHPWVGRTIAARVAAATAPAVVIEAIKLLEAGLSRQLCDQVWVTTCPREEQAARLAAGRGMSAAEVQRRLAHQMPPEQMIAHAARVIDTRGSLAETALLVCDAWAALRLPLPVPAIRAATPADAEAIAAVWRAIVAEGGLTVVDRPFTPAQERAYLEQLPPRGRITAAVVDEIVVGFQTLEPYATFTAAMDHVGVLGTQILAPWRGQGLGRRLSQATFDFARQAGFTKLVISVRGDNPGAQAFYTALGFQPCGRLARQALFEGRYVDELLFELFLADVTNP